MSYKFLDKEAGNTGTYARTGIICNKQQLANELHKFISRKFITTKIINSKILTI